MDKAWLLNRDALNMAKQCIEIIEREMGVRLKLADPNFLGLLGDYVELLESSSLSENVMALYKFAEIAVSFKPLEASSQLAAKKADVIQFYGKTYPKYQDEKEFKHLYRGQPVYA